MLCLDRRLCLLERSHVLEGAMEKGDGRDSYEEGAEIMIHEARVELAEDRREAYDNIHNLEDKDNNTVVLDRNNMHMMVDPRMIFF
jgi:hypothetical protein